MRVDNIPLVNILFTSVFLNSCLNDDALSINQRNYTGLVVRVQDLRSAGPGLFSVAPKSTLSYFVNPPPPHFKGVFGWNAFEQRLKRV